MNERKLRNSVLYPSSELIVKELDDFYFGFNVTYPNIIVMDQYGRAFVELCNGKRKVADILNQVCSRYEGKITAEELTAFAKSLVTNKIMSTDPVKEYDVPRRPTMNLRKLYANVTHSCNLNCKYCYIDAGKPYEDELTPQEFAEQIKAFSELGGQDIIITGGEPFLRKEVFRSIVTAARKEGIDSIDVETNGTLIDENDAKFCKENKVKVAIGLGGATAHTHALVRGKGFDEAIRGTKTLLQAGVETMVSMTVTQQNVHEAEDFLKMGKNLGAKGVTLNVVTNIGRAKQFPDLEVPLEDSVPLFEMVVKQGSQYGAKMAFEEVAMETKRLPIRNLCGVGVSVLSIAANGDVYPCNSFQDTPFRLGNVREKSLGEIWKESEAIKRFRNLTVSDLPKCRECEWRYVCSGGCLAQTYHASGTLAECSPHCAYFRKIYWVLISRLARRLWNQA